MHRDARIGLRQIPCSFPARANNSLRWQKYSLLVCVGNSSANTRIRTCFQDGCSQKAAESAKFPAFFPATREFGTSGYREFFRRQAAKGAGSRERGMLEKHGILTCRIPWS